CAANKCILAQRPCCLPNPSTDRAHRCVWSATDWTQSVTQNGLIRFAELQQLQRPTLVQMPDLVRCDLMPATETTLREQKVDRRQRSTWTASIDGSYLHHRLKHLSIEAALRVRAQIQRCDQLGGSWVHRKEMSIELLRMFSMP